MKRTIKKLIAIAMFVIMMFVNTPVIDVQAETNTIYIIVKDAKNDYVGDAHIYINEIEKGTIYADDKYQVDVSDITDFDGAKLVVKSSDEKVVCERDLTSDETEYEVVLKSEWKISNDDIEVNNGNYTAATEYVSSSGEYFFYVDGLEDSEDMDVEIDTANIPCVDPDCTEEDCNLGKINSPDVSYNKRDKRIELTYDTPGKVVIKCIPQDKYKEDKCIEFACNNTPRFNPVNSNDYQCTYSNGNLETVTKKITEACDSYDIQIPVQVNYEYDEILYSLSDNNGYSIDADGKVTVANADDVTVRAVSKITGATSSFTLSTDDSDCKGTFKWINYDYRFSINNNEVEINYVM